MTKEQEYQIGGDAYAFTQEHRSELSHVKQAELQAMLKDFAIQQVKKLNIDDVGVSFTDSERTEFVETTIFLNSQNLSGRETEDELYEAGIVDCFDDLIEKINER